MPKRNIFASCAGSEVDFCHRSGGMQGHSSESVKQLQFSPSGDRLAVVDSSVIAMFSVQDAQQLWQETIEDFIDQEEQAVCVASRQQQHHTLQGESCRSVA